MLLLTVFECRRSFSQPRVCVLNRENESFVSDGGAGDVPALCCVVPQHTNHSVSETGREEKSIGGGFSDASTCATRL